MKKLFKIFQNSNSSGSEFSEARAIMHTIHFVSSCLYAFYLGFQSTCLSRSRVYSIFSPYLFAAWKKLLYCMGVIMQLPSCHQGTRGLQQLLYYNPPLSSQPCRSETSKNLSTKNPAFPMKLLSRNCPPLIRKCFLHKTHSTNSKLKCTGLIYKYVKKEKDVLY